jgi:hypothetical protein
VPLSVRVLMRPLQLRRHAYHTVRATVDFRRPHPRESGPADTPDLSFQAPLTLKVYRC